MSLRAIYFVGWRDRDWTCKVELEKDGDAPTLYARWRYYDPTPRVDDVWDGVDQKIGSDMRFKPGTPLGIVIAAAEALQLTVAEITPGPPPEVVDSIVQEDGDYAGFKAQAETKTWLHTKTFKTAAEAERFLKSKEPS